MSFYLRGISHLVPEDNHSKTEFPIPSITQQHFKHEVNINTIIAKFNKTGILGDGQAAVPRYADVSLFGDFREAQEKIQMGKDAFMALPFEVRKLAGNDPQRVWEVLTNPANRGILEEAGVLEKIPKKVDPSASVDQSAQKPT